MTKNEAFSVVDLAKLFPDHESARKYLEKRRWPHGPDCPECGSVEIYTRSNGRAGNFDCRACGKAFSVRTGTVLERSKIKLHIWLFAIYTVVTASAEVNVADLTAEIGLQYKTVRFMLHRLRKVINCESD